MLYFEIFLYILFGYLIGSIPFAFIFTRWYKGKDIRKVAWGNVGTTNVMINIGKLPGLLTMIGDVLKGCMAVYIGAIYPFARLRFVLPGAAITGHNWPVWLKFKGGGGLATFIGGGLCLLDWYEILFMLGIWGVLHLLIKHPDKSAIIACIIAPILFIIGRKAVGPSVYVAGSSIAILIKRLQCLAAEKRRMCEGKIT